MDDEAHFLFALAQSEAQRRLAMELWEDSSGSGADARIHVRIWRNPLGEPEYALYTDSEELSKELSSKYYRARRPGNPASGPHEEDREAYDLARRIAQGDCATLRELDRVMDDLDRCVNELLQERCPDEGGPESLEHHGPAPDR